jgi:hypothetical protein
MYLASGGQNNAGLMGLSMPQDNPPPAPPMPQGQPQQAAPQQAAPQQAAPQQAAPQQAAPQQENAKIVQAVVAKVDAATSVGAIESIAKQLASSKITAEAALGSLIEKELKFAEDKGLSESATLDLFKQHIDDFKKGA